MKLAVSVVPGLPPANPLGRQLVGSVGSLDGVVLMRVRLGPRPSGLVGHGSASLKREDSMGEPSAARTVRVSPSLSREVALSNSPATGRPGPCSAAKAVWSATMRM